MNPLATDDCGRGTFSGGIPRAIPGAMSTKALGAPATGEIRPLGSVSRLLRRLRGMLLCGHRRPRLGCMLEHDGNRRLRVHELVALDGCLNLPTMTCRPSDRVRSSFYIQLRAPRVRSRTTPRSLGDIDRTPTYR